VEAVVVGERKISELNERAGAPAMDRRWVTGALMLVMVLSSMEMTVTSTAMPSIIGDLHGLLHYSWVQSIYLLAMTISMPLYGRLADAIGRKRVIVGAIGIFAVGSMLASMSRSMGQLILFRGIQGLGAGGIMPVVLTILGDIFTLKERANIQGFFSSVWGLSAVVGPALGAFLVNTLGWRSVFWVNLPFGVLGLGVLVWKYHEHQGRHKTDLDLVGVGALALFCMAVLVLVSGVELATEVASPAIFRAALISVAGGAGWFFWWHEKLASNPILPMDLMRNRAIGPGVIGSALFGAGFLSLDTYVPLYVQGGRGGGAAAAAGVVTPVMLTWALSGIVTAKLIVKYGFRKTAGWGVGLIVAGFVGLVLCAVFGAPRWLLTCVLSMTGLGFAPASMSYLLSAQEEVDWRQRGMITSTVTLTRTIGGAVGIGLLGALFNRITRDTMNELAAKGVSAAAIMNPKAGDVVPAHLVESVRGMIVRGSIWVFVGMVGVAVVQWAMTALLPKHKASHQVSAREAMEAMGG